MNPLIVLNDFLVAISSDSRIGPTHVSLYAALLKLWLEQSYKNPFNITRRQLMPLSKISGLATYHEKLQQLHEFGYIIYTPNFNPFKGSLVQLKQVKSQRRTPHS